MNAIAKKWNNFWFEPVTPDNLGLCRILLFGSMALFYLFTPFLFPTWGWHATFNEWGDVSPVYWHPIWLFRILHLPLLSTPTLKAIDAIWKVAMLFSAIGLFTRISTAITFILSVYLIGLPNNFGKTEHLDTLLIWAFLIMAFARCGDGWSIDNLLRAWRGRTDPPAVRALISGEYAWPVRLIWVVMATIYFEAGISKLRHSGLQWVTSDTMSNFLMRAQYHISNAEPLTHWGLFIARHGWMSHLLAASGLAIELSYVLALFSRRLRWIIVPSGMLMQFGIAVLMGPNFYQMIICQLLWLPLDAIVATMIGLVGGRGNNDLEANKIY